MHREIKFKVWDNVDYMSTPFTLIDLQLKKVQFTHDCQIMQYTGTKDNKGKEIYEGDIVKGFINRWDFVEGVGYFEESISVIEYEVIGFGIRDDSESNSWMWGHFEVIGNIYENPELLNT